MCKKFFLYCLSLVFVVRGLAQQCTFPGQTPVSAIYVCSSETFSITTPTFCGQSTIPVPCSDGVNYQNTNPNFFRFACYNPGTLGFIIVPDEATANYSWQLFDVTNTNPVDIFTNSNLFVACNWSGEPGETGASTDGINTTVCSGSGQNLFSKMPDLITGHTYLLMVCNLSGSTAGYQLTFTGGSAVITDAADPHLSVAEISCDRTSIRLLLNKQVKCNTVAADGSDFTVSGGVNVVGAVPADCTTQFGTAIITLSLDQPLGFGNYNLTMGDGNDGNTLIDVCSKSVPVGESISFVSAPAQSTPMDSVFNVVCSPSYIELVFRKPMLCSSIAADGSDFIITGPQAVTATPFLPACATNNTTYIIRLNLSASIIAGTYQVRLTTGNDGNTLMNECAVPTPAGSTVSFTAANAVSAVFTKSNASSCSESTVSFLHNGSNNVNSWNWNFGNGTNSTISYPVVSFAPGQYNVKLIVSNAVCSDTTVQVVKISKEFKAAFDAPSVICPGDTLHLINKSDGNIENWQWNFGNGVTSNQQTPVGHRYIDNGRETLYNVQLIISNSNLGCSDSVSHVVRALNNCIIAVPSAFTPNGDGKNDYLYPLNALKVANLEFKVFNRVGQLVFSSKDGTKKWDGRINGLPQDTGLYAWLLIFNHQNTADKVFMKGTTLLIR